MHAFHTLIRYFLIVFKSRNPGIWSLVIPGFRDLKTVRDPGIRDPGIAIPTDNIPVRLSQKTY